MSQFEGIETIHGHLDLGNRIGEEADHLLGLRPHDHAMPDELEEALAPPPPTVTVKDEAPVSAHYRTFTLDGTEAQEISSPYPNRANITITCQAGGPARIGADNQIGSVDGDAKSVRLPLGASRVMTHTGKIFAHGPANTVVDVVEEHLTS